MSNVCCATAFLFCAALLLECECCRRGGDGETIKESGVWRVWEVLAKDDDAYPGVMLLDGLPVNNLYYAQSNFKRSEAKKHFGPNERYAAHPLLMLAATSRATKCMDMLVNYGADMSTRSLTGTTTLFACAFLRGEDSVKWAERLLEHPNISVNDTNFYGETPLVWAMRRDNTALFDYLISRGAKYDTKLWKLKDGDYICFLFEAVKSSPKILERFLELSGVDARITDKEGRNALFFVPVGDKNYDEKIRILTAHGADINARVNPQTVVTRLVHYDFKERLTPSRVNFLRDMGISEELIREGQEFARQHGHGRSKKVIEDALEAKK